MSKHSLPYLTDVEKAALIERIMCDDNGLPYPFLSAESMRIREIIESCPTWSEPERRAFAEEIVADLDEVARQLKGLTNSAYHPHPSESITANYAHNIRNMVRRVIRKLDTECLYRVSRPDGAPENERYPEDAASSPNVDPKPQTPEPEQPGGFDAADRGLRQTIDGLTELINKLNGSAIPADAIYREHMVKIRLIARDALYLLNSHTPPAPSADPPSVFSRSRVVDESPSEGNKLPAPEDVKVSIKRIVENKAFGFYVDLSPGNRLHVPASKLAELVAALVPHLTNRHAAAMLRVLSERINKIFM